MNFKNVKNLIAIHLERDPSRRADAQRYALGFTNGLMNNPRELAAHSAQEMVESLRDNDGFRYQLSLMVFALCVANLEEDYFCTMKKREMI